MSTAVAEPKKTNGDKPLTIRERLKSPSLIAELGKAMPKHCEPERMARVALTALTRTPKLAECTEASFFECMLNLSQWGLEPDGRRAHLIPYGNTCTLIIDYKGLVELAYRSGVVAAIHADVVCDNDEFEYDLGEIKFHKIDLKKPRGKPYAAYCRVLMKDGSSKCEVMSHDEIESIRKRSKAGRNGPWVTDWSEMAKKTCFRRVSKWLPLSADIHDAFEKDADRIQDIIPAESKSPVTLDSLTEILNQSKPEPEQFDQVNIDEDLPESSYDPAGEPDEDERDDWTKFNDAVKNATTVKDVDAVENYWSTKDFGAVLNSQVITLCNDRRAAIKAAPKGKQKQMLDTSPTNNSAGQ